MVTSSAASVDMPGVRGTEAASNWETPCGKGGPLPLLADRCVESDSALEPLLSPLVVYSLAASKRLEAWEVWGDGVRLEALLVWRGW
jgi:hypothetical protein